MSEFYFLILRKLAKMLKDVQFVFTVFNSFIQVIIITVI